MTKQNSVIEYSVLENAVREELDASAPRRLGVLDPLKLVITKGVDVANVVNLGRGPTAAQRVALLWQQPKCSNIACSST